MSVTVESWFLPGSEGRPMLGDVHLPAAEPHGVIIILHGFKGYKDYGMFPRIAAECAASGFIAIRFNFSHSGMTHQIEMFERPDLFELDTWNKQVIDARTVIEAVARGELPGGGLPYVLFGHSRGGVTAILTAGRHADDPDFPQPAGIVTAAAPDTACSLSEDDRQRLLREGYLESPSSRTGQKLRLGRAFLQEQLDDPGHHDVLALAARITCPMLIIHGEVDPTVPVSAAQNIANATGPSAKTLIIPGGDHVFNTPNPMPPDVQASPQLAALLSATVEFLRDVAR